MSYRQLNPAQGLKPLDLGSGGITFSINLKARLIALNAYHPQYGYISLSSASPFPEAERYKPDAVRAYRKSLVNLEGFGLEFDSAIVKQEAGFLADAIPQIRLSLANGLTVEVTSFIPLSLSDTVIQIWNFSDNLPAAYFSGKVWLQRSAYTQLTEGGPVAMPSSKTVIYQKNPLVIIGNQELASMVLLSTETAVETNDGGIEFRDPSLQYPIENSPEINKTLILGMGSDLQNLRANEAQLRQMDLNQLLQENIESWEKRWENIADDPILRRGLVYSLSCCVPIDDEATCILTDHMLLALSWNRDAYYAALALLHWKQADATEQVRRHLIWLFEKAERMEKQFWGRSYLANGKIKDYGFQLDQQLFPLLELADYFKLTGDEQLLARLQAYIEPLLAALLARRATNSSLFPTDETPADDPIAYPYHFSSHLLFWYLLKRLPEIADKAFGQRLRELESQIREAIYQNFVAQWNGRSIYAYATDGKGNHHLYHDANDLPLALAAAWGFCSADEPVWKATIDFAFSPDNRGGYYDGRLGSVHTPAAWALGDIQDLIIARTMDDALRIQTALHHLQKAAQWDGALPEAYDPKTGDVVSRHWFVWPNAAYACTLLGAFNL